MRCVGGPLDGQDIESVADVVVLAEAPDMEYVRTRPTDTNWRAEYDPDWWIKNLPDPMPPAHVYEWHQHGWQSPEVRMIGDAIAEASARFR